VVTLGHGATMYGDPRGEDGIQESWIPSWLDYFFLDLEVVVTVGGQPVVGPLYCTFWVLEQV
jgi:hypothetical protein